MPSKSRHSSRKKSFKTSKKVAASTPVSAQPKSEAAVQVKTPARPGTPAPVASAPAVAVSYPYINAELMRTGIIAAAIFIILVILYFVL